MTKLQQASIETIARTGLIAKGIVYLLLGGLAFMAAIHFNGQSTDDADQGGVFSFVQRQTGGQIILALIVIGLLCYSLWRMIQAFKDTEQKGSDSKGIMDRARYFLSALMYASFALIGAKILFSGNKNNGDSKQELAKQLLDKPFGQWLVGVAAIIIIIVGVYQIFYGLSEKYRKHVTDASNNDGKKIMLTAGKIGYIARGIVWLIIGWLFIKAALHANSSEAGDTSKAFGFLSGMSFGPYLLALTGIGLVCYGVFSFVRAKYERLHVMK
jgi:hypothetical protein